MVGLFVLSSVSVLFMNFSDVVNFLLFLSVVGLAVCFDVASTGRDKVHTILF